MVNAATQKLRGLRDARGLLVHWLSKNCSAAPTTNPSANAANSRVYGDGFGE